MNNNRQLLINMGATIAAFAIGTCISFFLTPFIVNHLGQAAYGFIGLASSIIDYTTLITVALNAMAGRFISICYMRGDVATANKYFSSVFFSNLFLAGFIFLLSIFFLVFIDSIINIPITLLEDVRLLFSILVLNSLIGLVTNVFGVATFIKNRLDLASIRSVVANIIRAAILFIAFGSFAPHVWYVGLSGFALVIYTVYFNIKYRNRLTPDLRVNVHNFEFKKVIELIKSGAWNIINKLSNILSQGLDLLFANLFVGATAMGTFSISKTVPIMSLSLMAQIANTFAPQLTNYYAQGQMWLIVNDLKKSIRVVSCFSTPILCSLYVFSGDFYHLWLPGQDYKELWLLTLLGFIEMPFTMPQEALWNVFTITNKLKLSSLALFCESIGVFITILILMCFFKNPINRLMILASVRSIWAFFRSMFFLPMYSAHCLHQHKCIFYNHILRSVLCLVLASGLAWVVRVLLPACTWMLLVVDVCIACIIGFTCNFYLVMTRHDRIYLLSQLSSVGIFKHNLTKK